MNLVFSWFLFSRLSWPVGQQFFVCPLPIRRAADSQSARRALLVYLEAVRVMARSARLGEARVASEAGSWEPGAGRWNR